MKSLLLAQNLSRRSLTTSATQCKYISPYDNPMPKDVNAPNVLKWVKHQVVHRKTKGFDKEVMKLQKDDHYISNPEKAKYLANSKLKSFYDTIKTKGYAFDVICN